jgi:hypothetical protein
MSSPDPQKIHNLLSDYGDSGLRKIVRQTQRLQAADSIVKKCLPENLRDHCQVADISATQLTLVVHSAAWLTPLRYGQQALLQQLKKHPQFNYLQTIQLRIQPIQNNSPKTEKPAAPRLLSTATKELIKSTAETITHPELKKALLKLSH